MIDKDAIIIVKNLSVLSTKKHQLDKVIVENISFQLKPNEITALIGESGSGKTITALSILGLLPNNIKTTGDIFYNGINGNELSQQVRRQLFGKKIGYVFQNYYDSCTPYIKIGKQFIELIQSHKKNTNSEAKKMATEMLEQLSLPAERVMSSYPFQLSGGQMQRVAIALALVLKPEVLIVDEPTTAIDAVNRKTMIELLKKIQQITQCSILIISHDLNDVLSLSDQILVMYKGKIVETGQTKKIAHHALHPYTKLLLESRPKLLIDQKRLPVLPEECPSEALNFGCVFINRCPNRVDLCKVPPMLSKIDTNHFVACSNLSQ